MSLVLDGTLGLQVPASSTGNSGLVAWAKWNGNGSISSNASYNVASIVRNSTGNYTVTFSNALVDALYATTTGVSYDLTTGNGDVFVKIVSQTSSAVNLLVLSTGGTAIDVQYVAIMCAR